MNPEQFEIFLERNERSTREAIEKTVNGKLDRLDKKIDQHNSKHEADMVEVREHIAEVKPILTEYKEREAARAFALRTGNAIKWIAGVGTALGVLWLMVLQFLKNHV